MKEISQESVKDYYGKVLASTDDLQTNACCTAEAMPVHLRPILKEIHDGVKDKFYGCGSPIPLALEGATTLDLGCGSGRDVYLMSKLVGDTGKVYGVDMTDEQLSVAREYQDHQAKTFGHTKPNTEFVKAYIEDLETAGIPSNSVDVVTSNCVINLSPDKGRVLREVFRVLKPGGELYFSDVFADRRIPKELLKDDVLLGECLSGALYVEDFRRMLAEVGCHDFRVMSGAPITIDNPEIEKRIGMVNFRSITIRAFKLDLEDRCEDFGQIAVYKGGIENATHAFTLDDHHTFEVGKPTPVCGNTADMLSKSRFGEFFEVIGDKTTHFGIFDCGPEAMSTNSNTDAGACC